jgi:hypothetical protein
MLADAGALALIRDQRERVPIQTRALARWADGSIQWLLIDFRADVRLDEATQYVLTQDVETWNCEATSPHVNVAEDTGSVVVDTGAARFVFRRGDRFPFGHALVSGRSHVDGARSGLDIEDAQGRRWEPQIGQVRIEERGPLRAALFVTAEPEAGGDDRPLHCFARLHFFAGLATVRVELTVRNPRRAEHKGGYWELGDAGSVFLRDVSLALALSSEAGRARVSCSAECGTGLAPTPAPIALYQDSSGGENWRSTNHLNGRRLLPLTFRGYEFTAGGEQTLGLRATPIVALERDDCMLAVTSQHFWQNFPKAVEASADSIVLRLWPRQTADDHEIQGGEQKTHVVHVAFGSDPVDPTPLEWGRSPAAASVPPSWYCTTRAVPYLMPYVGGSSSAHLALAASAIEGSESFALKRERVDEYGWRHFGDIYADHEAAFDKGPSPLISHYNNQYDVVAGFACQFMQTGDHRWWPPMVELASHVCDIDIYHTTEDKAAYNGGMFWHTAHYVDAGISTHRTYPRAAGGGGGPSADHNYTTGLMLHHFLTGEARTRDAVIGLAEWVLTMDDGRATVFWWLDRSFTGLASASDSWRYHGPGRGGGNSLRALLDGHRLTGDQRFLDKAEQLLRRSIHPRDAIEDGRLLDVERRWFYTVFLRAVGAYLDYKIELGQLDRMYAYGRASLLAYARWMVDHEQPYLDRPEALEFPNETWAAQDMRKSDVLALAAKHADASERQRFLERSAFFFNYSLSTLAASPGHARTRPTALMLANGWVHSYLACHPYERAPAPTGTADFGLPTVFVPQKLRALRRCVWLLLAAASAAGAYFVLTLMG